MDQRVQVGGLGVAASLHRFVEEEALPGSGVESEAFWDGVGAIVHDLAPRNRELLARRDELQSPHRRLAPRAPRHARRRGLHRVPARDRLPARRARRRSRSPPPTSTTRWPGSPARSSSSRCSTPASPPTPSTPGGARSTTRSTAPTWSRRTATSRPATSYNKVRGDEVIARGRALLDEHFPLDGGSHADATSYAVDADGPRRHRQGRRRSGSPTPPSWSATGAPPEAPEAVLLVHHGLHVEIQVDRDDSIGSHRRRRGQGPAASSPRSPRSWTSRTRSPPSTPRTRCSATATGSG